MLCWFLLKPYDVRVCLCTNQKKFATKISCNFTMNNFIIFSFVSVGKIDVQSIGIHSDFSRIALFDCCWLFFHFFRTFSRLSVIIITFEIVSSSCQLMQRTDQILAPTNALHMHWYQNYKRKIQFLFSFFRLFDVFQLMIRFFSPPPIDQLVLATLFFQSDILWINFH